MKIVELLQQELGEDYQIEVTNVVKNNGLKRNGICIRREGEKISPAIYLNEFFYEYRTGKSITSILDEILQTYQDSCLAELMEEPPDVLKLEAVKDKIVYRIVNFQKNEKELQMTPYIRLLDLAVTFHCLLQKTPEGIGTIRVTNKILKKWGTDTKFLWEKAGQNTKRLFPVRLRPIEDLITGALEEGFETKTIKKSAAPLPMYVLTNEYGINGAAAMLYDHVVRGLADSLQSDLFILPSSIHEIILVPVQEHFTRESLSDMVYEINRTQLAQEDILSDHVYVYKRNSDAFIM